MAHVRVLVIGSGGREHAIVRALARDPGVSGLHAAPGNPGIAELAQLHEVKPADPADVTRLAEHLNAGLVVIGPEVPLVAGVADALRAAGIAVFGPDAAAARIEGSKAFAKEVMTDAGIPTARSFTCHSEAEADVALATFGPPYVVKDDALAAGKGVVVTDDLATARKHAAACGKVVIEEYLDGPEVSLFALADGTAAIPLLPAQDFKRARDGDQGPNTGGMGAYAPLPWAPPDLADTVLGTVIRPAIGELRRRGTPYRGLLYAGLALTSKGVKVVEFNARFGDPETQVVLDRLATPLAGLLQAAAAGDLAAAPNAELAARCRGHGGARRGRLSRVPGQGRQDQHQFSRTGPWLPLARRYCSPGRQPGHGGRPRAERRRLGAGSGRGASGGLRGRGISRDARWLVPA